MVVTPQSADWTVKYKKDDTSEIYTLVPPPAGQGILFTFSRWPAPGNADQMPGFLDTMAAKFAETAQRNPKIQLDSTNYTKGEFIGYPFSGNYVEFTIKGGLKQVLFMFSEGSGIWNGQYIGPADGWLDAWKSSRESRRASLAKRIRAWGRFRHPRIPRARTPAPCAFYVLQTPPMQGRSA